MKRFNNEKQKHPKIAGVNRLLSKIKNEEIRIDKDEKNIGGNELLLTEMIEQANLKKGYISKAQMMRIKLANLTLVAH
jgi:hypothetical protein